MTSRLMLHLHQVADLGVLTEHGVETAMHFNTVNSDEDSAIEEGIE